MSTSSTHPTRQEQLAAMREFSNNTNARHRELEGRLKELMAARKLSVFVFGIGRADLSELCSISPGRPPMRVNDQKFPELFAWLSRSVRMASMSMPGDGVSLTPLPDDMWQV